MSSGDPDRCQALTEGGERCSRPARENGFCHQHDSDDETIDEETNDEETDEETNDEETDEETNDEGDAPTESNTDQETESMSQETENATEIDEVRAQVQSIAEDVVGHPLDGITSIGRDEEMWRVAVEVVERKGVPDTQDILGRYEILLEEDLSVDSYERTHRFRRDDMEHNV